MNTEEMEKKKLLQKLEEEKLRESQKKNLKKKREKSKLISSIINNIHLKKFVLNFIFF